MFKYKSLSSGCIADIDYSAILPSGDAKVTLRFGIVSWNTFVWIMRAVACMSQCPSAPNWVFGVDMAVELRSSSCCARILG